MQFEMYLQLNNLNTFTDDLTDRRREGQYFLDIQTDRPTDILVHREVTLQKS